MTCEKCINTVKNTSAAEIHVLITFAGQMTQMDPTNVALSYFYYLYGQGRVEKKGIVRKRGIGRRGEGGEGGSGADPALMRRCFSRLHQEQLTISCQCPVRVPWDDRQTAR